MKQLQDSHGVLSTATRAQSPLVFLTMTSWGSKESMIKFRNNGAHLEAMKATRSLAREAVSANYEGEALPSWKEVPGLIDKHQKSRYL